VALARALAKAAPLMLLDEPLVNLDYKLREELRDELTELFATGESTVVYATTEPAEALLLGGYTAVLDAGELLQYGPTTEVFHSPASVRVARAFSDPPMNLLKAQLTEHGLQLDGGPLLPMTLPNSSNISITAGLRASALRLQTPEDGVSRVALPGKVQLAEISGSDTFVHVNTPCGELVVQLSGVHSYELGIPVTVYIDPRQTHVFDAAGMLIMAALRPGER
jgi:glycerol transport system ATP-binding protein